MTKWEISKDFFMVTPFFELCTWKQFLLVFHFLTQSDINNQKPNTSIIEKACQLSLKKRLTKFILKFLLLNAWHCVKSEFMQKREFLFLDSCKVK